MHTPMLAPVLTARKPWLTLQSTHRVPTGNKAEKTACRMTQSYRLAIVVGGFVFFSGWTPQSSSCSCSYSCSPESTTPQASRFESRDFHHGHPFLWGHPECASPQHDWPLLKIAASTIGHPMPFAGKASARAGVLLSPAANHVGRLTHWPGNGGEAMG